VKGEFENCHAEAARQLASPFFFDFLNKKQSPVRGLRHLLDGTPAAPDAQQYRQTKRKGI
jgi:hypothetical protein